MTGIRRSSKFEMEKVAFISVALLVVPIPVSIIITASTALLIYLAIVTASVIPFIFAIIVSTVISFIFVLILAFVILIAVLVLIIILILPIVLILVGGTTSVVAITVMNFGAVFRLRAIVGSCVFRRQNFIRDGGHQLGASIVSRIFYDLR